MNHSDSSYERFCKLIEIAPSYTELPLQEFFLTVCTLSGYPRDQVLDMIDNVFINEVVYYPDMAGYFEWQGEYWFWSTNERNQIYYKKFAGASQVAASFVQTAPKAM